jgi:hypothetical protein
MADPLSGLDPQREATFDEVSRLAREIVIAKDDVSKSGRAMLRGLMLHVLTARQFAGERDLIMLRKLILCGEWRLAEAMRERGGDTKTAESPYLLLWRSMELNPAFGGIVSSLGSQFRFMMKSAPKTFQDVLQIVQMQVISRSYGAAFTE